MKENAVFWLGRRSKSGDERKRFADEPDFVTSMQKSCEAHGCRIQRFVSAKGPYGTWLLEFERDGKSQRVVWNGREEKLVLQVALNTGGWEEPAATKIVSIDVQGFIDGIRLLIGRDVDPNA
jgi:hypothetical protein